MRGKLVVIDGGDGAGKATQTTLLVKRLRAEGKEVVTLDFPQYAKNIFGRLLRECLDGQRGDFMALDPRIASTLYAADRFESKPLLEQWLAEGQVVVLDRYVSANMLHQGAKVSDDATRKAFLSWLDHIEHGVFGLPRPDLIVYLDVPQAIRQSLIEQAVGEGKHGSKADSAERSIEHQQQVEERARDITATYNQWVTIACVAGSTMRSREAIHEDVYQLVCKHL